MERNIVFTLKKCAIVRDIRALVLGDLHIGFEHELLRSGISIPSQSERMLSICTKIAERRRCRKIILLGDVKHNLPGAGYEESKKTEQFLASLCERCEVVLVKGNHDGEIEKHAPEGVKIVDSKGVRIKDYAFAHGNAWIDEELLKARILFLAHEHAGIELSDGRSRVLEPCWIVARPRKEMFEEKFGEKCRLKRVIVLPAFNPVLGCFAINVHSFSPLSPNLKFCDMEHAEIFLSSGEYLGKLKYLTEG